VDRLLAQGLEELRRRDRDADAALAGRLDAVLELLLKYLEEIERFNGPYGLVKVRDREELAVKHILDSLSPLGVFCRLLAALPSPPPRVVDVGSGAGLPGIPLAIALPRITMTLLERKGRRAGFLRNAAAALALPNVAVEAAELERAAGNRFDLAVFRAFRPLDQGALRSLTRLLRPGGCLAAYKGRRTVIEAELGAMPGGAWEIIPCPVPFLNEERHVAVMRTEKSDKTGKGSPENKRF
jgi:16S rRNA (guanine527-N7)-methyltransferase